MPRINQIQVRRDTAANWTSVNPTLAAGEIGFESDTNKFKIGNGSTAWTSRPYAAGDVAGLVSQTNGTVTTASASSNVVRNITLSTSAPIGGMDGDVWMVYS
jgi:hypothetical protein